MTAERHLVYWEMALICKATLVTFPIPACLQNIH